MTLLLPLGLLGLLSLAVLILIYILRPNYQQKLVSSTFIWKLSLKYRKNRIPISRLRNILILICQLLLLACLALLMARPALFVSSDTSEHETVAIIDASAGMMVASQNETRFERAVRQVRDMAQDTLGHDDGVFSVIVADGDAHFLISRLTAEDDEEIGRRLALLEEIRCGYGSADIEGAAELAQQILTQNSQAQIVLYTATEYLDTGSFRVVDVSGEDDWNAAILNVTPVLEESNTYSFSVDAGCYGQAKPMTVSCELLGVNGNANAVLRASKTEYFTDLAPEKTITFTRDDFDGNGEAIVSFREMYVHVDEDDTFERDNTFNVYGGTRQTIRIQYASSTLGANFFPGILNALRDMKREIWDIEIVEVAPDRASTSGFDFYIFEHVMPETTPNDGVVLFADPDAAPEGSGLTLGGLQQTGGNATLALGAPHAITQFVDPGRIPTIINEYRRVIGGDGYDELLYCNGEPILLAKNEPRAKIMVLAVNFAQTDYSVTPDFSIIMYNMFEYYFPATLEKYAFEVGETVTINARGEDLSADGPNGAIELGSLPALFTAEMPGDYTITQTAMTGLPVVEQFFVHIPAAESRIFKVEDRLPSLYADPTREEGITELTVWFASAALALLIVEWFLHARENL